MIKITKAKIPFTIKQTMKILTAAGIIAVTAALNPGAVQAQQLVNSKYITGVTNKEWTGVAFVNNGDRTTDYLRSDLASSGSTRLKIPHTTEKGTWKCGLGWEVPLLTITGYILSKLSYCLSGYQIGQSEAWICFCSASVSSETLSCKSISKPHFFHLFPRIITRYAKLYIDILIILYYYTC